MARLPRIHEPGAVYHVMSRGVDGRLIFATDDDRCEFLAAVKAALSEQHASLLAYCLMGNHYHLLVSVGEVPLGKVMHRVLSRYAVHFNRVAGRVGHLFQTRYTAIICRNLPYLVKLVVYIHSNPVRASLVEQAEAWLWSSHRELLGEGGGMLDLSRLAEVSGMPIAEFRACYLEEMKPRQTRRARTLDECLVESAAAFGVTPEEVVSGAKGGPFTCAKRRFIRVAENNGFTDADVARALKCSRAAVAQLRSRGC